MWIVDRTLLDLLPLSDQGHLSRVVLWLAANDIKTLFPSGV
jgi:hypothetical protein